MSSKKAKLKPFWLYSEESRGYILNRQRQASDNDTPVQFTHFGPNISEGGVFTGQVVLMKETELKIAENVKNCIVELHPDTMQLCDMRLGGPVIVSSLSQSSESLKAAFRVWPSISVPLGKVALSQSILQQLQLSEDQSVSVQDTGHTCEPALFINAEVGDNGELDSKIINSSFFEEYLHHILDKRYFIIDQPLSVEYYGRIMCLKIVDAADSDAQHHFSSESTFDSSGVSDLSFLGDSFADISLHSTGDAGRNFSTPKSKFTAVQKNSKRRTPTGKTPDLRVFLFTNSTKINFINKEVNSGLKHQNDEVAQYFGDCNYDDIGGLEMQIKLVKEMMELPMKKPGLFKKSGLCPPTGILLHGPPGTGKSMLVKACVNETGVKVLLLQGAKILSRYFGDSEQKLHDLFQKAREESPSIIVIDEIDAICSQRDSTRSDVEKRLVSSFITLLDGVTAANQVSTKYVILLATTNRIDALDPSLRRAGRFDCEIEIPIPSPRDRRQIFCKLLSNTNHTLEDRDIDNLSEKAHGYVGADIAAVCRESGMKSLQRSLNESGNHEDIQIIVDLADFEYGLKQVAPSAMREMIVQVPKVLWSDIGGNSEVKKKLKQSIEWPLKNPQAFERLGIEPPRGVLLYGPPGCSKTLTAKALATESGLNFISIKGPELFSKYVGDSEKAIRKIFSKARSAAPSIVFFDELDALANERGGSSSKGGGNVAGRVLAAMLTEMDGVEQRRDVIVVAATNRPDMIDKALLRPGRIDRIVHVPLPDSTTRKDIFQIQFRKTPIADDVDIEVLVQKTDMYSGAEICAVCREAALAALDDDMDSCRLTSQHFERAIAAVPPQTTKELVEMYVKYSKTLQSNIK